MGRARNYEIGLFNEFEKVNQKLDKANNTILNMSLTINELNENNKKLTKNLDAANIKFKNCYSK